MAKVVMFGVGQLSELFYSYMLHDSPHEVVAFTVDSEFLDRKAHMGLPVASFEEVDDQYPPDAFSMVVPVGYRGGNRTRALKYVEAKEKGYSLLSYVSSHAIVSPDASIGEHCLILEHSVIQPFARIGNDVIVGSGNQIGHHTEIGEHCFISHNTVVLGSVKIGPYCFLGANSTIRDRIAIGPECIIGAGALILEDTPARSVYRGAAAVRLNRDSSTFYDL